MQIDYGPGSAALRTANTPPSLEPLPDFVINEQAPFSFTASASDADLPVQTLSYSLFNAPDGATINSTNGVFAWTPAEAQGPGNYSITLRVGDSGTPVFSATRTFQIQVREVNAAPELAVIADVSGHAGTPVRIVASATDPDQPANVLTYSLLKAPDGAALARLTGEFVWVPSDDQVGAHAVMLQVVDNGSPSLAATGAFNVVVVSRPVLEPITFSGGKPVLVWSAISGTRYRVQYRPDLTSSGWIEVDEDVVASGNWATLEDSTASVMSNRFYRIRVLP
jgi:hypothetical protein